MSENGSKMSEMGPKCQKIYLNSEMSENGSKMSENLPGFKIVRKLTLEKMTSSFKIQKLKKIKEKYFFPKLVQESFRNIAEIFSPKNTKFKFFRLEIMKNFE